MSGIYFEVVHLKKQKRKTVLFVKRDRQTDLLESIRVDEGTTSRGAPRRQPRAFQASPVLLLLEQPPLDFGSSPAPLVSLLPGPM